MCLRGIAVVARCLVRYGSTSRNGRVWGWGQFRVDCEWKTEGETGVLAGGESKPGSTEDEGIGGDGKLEKQMLCPKTNISSSERSNSLPRGAPTRSLTTVCEPQRRHLCSTANSNPMVFLYIQGQLVV
jgi:hypothetical protein